MQSTAQRRRSVASCNLATKDRQWQYGVLSGPCSSHKDAMKVANDSCLLTALQTGRHETACRLKTIKR